MSFIRLILRSQSSTSASSSTASILAAAGPLSAAAPISMTSLPAAGIVPSGLSCCARLRSICSLRSVIKASAVVGRSSAASSATSGRSSAASAARGSADMRATSPGRNSHERPMRKNSSNDDIKAPLEADHARYQSEETIMTSVENSPAGTSSLRRWWSIAIGVTIFVGLLLVYQVLLSRVLGPDTTDHLTSGFALLEVVGGFVCGYVGAACGRLVARDMDKKMFLYSATAVLGSVLIRVADRCVG